MPAILSVLLIAAAHSAHITQIGKVHTYEPIKLVIILPG